MKYVALAALIAVACPGAAGAQNHTLAPAHGAVSLGSGFSPDPNEIAVSAGGPIEADDLGAGCTGHIANAPSVRVDYRAGSFPLVFRSRAASDTVLAVRSPGGGWSCNDDGWSDGNAEVRYDDPASGTYNVWVGSYRAGDTVAAALLITELPDSDDGSDGGDWSAAEPVSNVIDIQVCNQSGRSAKVGVSYVEVGTQQFINRGWYDVANGACETLVSTDNQNFYMYADASDGSGLSWSGGHALCVEYPGPYTFYSTGAEYCEDHQEVRNFVPMTVVETGVYTWTLNP